MRIRNETPDDIPVIQEVTWLAFASAKHTSGTEPLIVDALRTAGALSVSLVAEKNGQVVGHVALSPVTLDGAESAWYGLGPISVLPQEQGRGVGAALMHAALAELRRRNAHGCTLVGDPGYYARFGFVQAAPLLLADVPPQYFQALALSGSVPSGVVRYHPAFEVQG